MKTAFRLPLLFLSLTLLTLSSTVEGRSFPSSGSASFDSAQQDLKSHHVINKRSFNQLGCLGDYDTASFPRLDRICEDCYNLFKDVSTLELCRSRCFTTDVFDRCCQVLLVDMEEEKIREKVNEVNGRD